jgi:hypothetical protein
MPRWGGEDMSILWGFKLFHVILVFCMCFVFITTIFPQGYCEDDWVYVVSNKYHTWYYNSSSVKIDKRNHIIKLWTKCVYTDKGKIDFLKRFDGINKSYTIDKNYNDTIYSLNLEFIDYKEKRFSFTHITHYSKSGNVLDSFEYSPEWKDIIPDSTYDKLLNRIMEDYNIKR